MTPTPEQLVPKIHAAPLRAVLAVTGGGSGVIVELLRIPGASRTVLEALVPYAPAALAAFLGAPPEQACSARTARAMAMAAFQRALHWETKPPSAAAADLAGIACTASLASDRPKRGPHRAHAAVQTSEFTLTQSLALAKGARSRPEEEALLTSWLLNLVARSAGVDPQLPLPLREQESISTQRDVAKSGWSDLLLGAARTVRHGPAPAGAGRVMFPGAFNPLHDGHRQMALLAGKLLGGQVEFEISIENVDKPTLDFTEMSGRLAQFDAAQTVWFTRLPTFVEKARAFPAATFVVGADTIARIAEPRYYGDDAEACAAAIAEIAATGCRFLVFGRKLADRFQSLADLELPDALGRLCREVPADTFRADVSSTELRARDGDQARR